MDPLPAPSTSRTPLPRLIDRIAPATANTTTTAATGTGTATTSTNGTTNTIATIATEASSSRSEGLRIKGSASRHRVTPPVTVHLAPAPADSTSSDINSPPPDLVPGAAAARKRKSPSPDSDSDGQQGPLLSEYSCPICFSPPRSAIITPCGHILCGSCLYGSIIARPAPQPLCPVCRTPMPNLQFSLPPSVPSPTHTPAPQPRPRPRVPPPSRVIGGVRLPTGADDMVLPSGRDESEVIDVDSSEWDDLEPQRKQRWDPSRSGVIGLEILTLDRL